MNIDFAKKQLRGNDLKFFNSAMKMLNYANINVKFYKKKYFNGNVGLALGFYDKTFRCLCVAIKKEPSLWFPTFVHEYCHFLQDMNGLLEKKYYAYYKSPIRNKKKRYEICKTTADMELDCEKRTIKICKKWKLSIDREKYIQVANSNICYYYFLAKYGNSNSDIFSVVLEFMPKKLDVNHEELLEIIINIENCLSQMDKME